MKAFIALSCLVVAVVADGLHGHAHGPVVAVAPLRPVRPLLPAPLAITPLRPILAPARPYHPAPAPYAPPPPPPPAPYGPVPVYPDSPPVYEYGYGVQIDPYHGGANFGHNEARNGYSTNGEYRVDLPDGRTQIVTYTVADALSGFVADVKYVNKAVPAYAPAPIPAYGPAPRPAYAAPARPYRPAIAVAPVPVAAHVG